MVPRSDRLALVPALLSTRWTRIGKLPDSAQPSGVKRNANEITIPPLQPAKAHSPKIVEWNAEHGGHNVEPAQSNTGSVVCHIADAARVDAGLAGKKHERAPIDDGSTFRAALKKVVFFRDCGIWRRHDAAVWVRKTKPPSGVWHLAALPRWVRTRGNCPVDTSLCGLREAATKLVC
jgi:hypothetical protein